MMSQNAKGEIIWLLIYFSVPTVIVKSLSENEPTRIIRTWTSETPMTTWSTGEPLETVQTWSTDEPSKTIYSWSSDEPSETVQTWSTGEPSKTIYSWSSGEPSETVQTWSTDEPSKTVQTWSTDEPSKTIYSWSTGDPSETIHTKSTSEPSKTIKSWSTTEPAESVSTTFYITEDSSTVEPISTVDYVIKSQSLSKDQSKSSESRSKDVSGFNSTLTAIEPRGKSSHWSRISEIEGMLPPWGNGDVGGTSAWTPKLRAAVPAYSTTQQLPAVPAAPAYPMAPAVPATPAAPALPASSYSYGVPAANSHLWANNAYQTSYLPASNANFWATSPVPASNANSFATSSLPASSADSWATSSLPAGNANYLGAGYPTTVHDSWGEGGMPNVMLPQGISSSALLSQNSDAYLMGLTEGLRRREIAEYESRPSAIAAQRRRQAPSSKRQGSQGIALTPGMGLLSGLFGR